MRFNALKLSFVHSLQGYYWAAGIPNSETYAVDFEVPDVELHQASNFISHVLKRGLESIIDLHFKDDAKAAEDLLWQHKAIFSLKPENIDESDRKALGRLTVCNPKDFWGSTIGDNGTPRLALQLVYDEGLAAISREELNKSGLQVREGDDSSGLQMPEAGSRYYDEELKYIE